MIRYMLALAAGYFSITLINSFIYLIVAVYFQTDITFIGINHLPSPVWAYGITILQFLLGMFSGLLVSTISQTRVHLVILVFILLMVIIGLINYSMLINTEPLWYLIITPLLQISGIYSGYTIYQNQPNPEESMS